MGLTIGFGLAITHDNRPAGLAGILVALGATSWYDSRDIA